MTAVEELIKEMEQLKDTKLCQGSCKAIQDCIHLAYAKLELEEEQRIEFAWHYTVLTKEELRQELIAFKQQDQ